MFGKTQETQTVQIKKIRGFFWAAGVIFLDNMLVDKQGIHTVQTAKFKHFLFKFVYNLYANSVIKKSVQLWI